MNILLRDELDEGQVVQHKNQQTPTDTQKHAEQKGMLAHPANEKCESGIVYVFSSRNVSSAQMNC